MSEVENPGKKQNKKLKKHSIIHPITNVKGCKFSSKKLKLNHIARMSRTRCVVAAIAVTLTILILNNLFIRVDGRSVEMNGKQKSFSKEKSKSKLYIVSNPESNQDYNLRIFCSPFESQNKRNEKESEGRSLNCTTMIKIKSRGSPPDFGYFSRLIAAFQQKSKDDAAKLVDVFPSSTIQHSDSDSISTIAISPATVTPRRRHFKRLRFG